MSCFLFSMHIRIARASHTQEHQSPRASHLQDGVGRLVEEAEVLLSMR